MRRACGSRYLKELSSSHYRSAASHSFYSFYSTSFSHSSSSSSSSCSSNTLRLGHASEIFRSSFLKARDPGLSYSVDDLDQMVITEKCRPSILIPLWECSSFIAGKITTILPMSAQSSVERAVNSAVVQVLNDCVRDAEGNVDAKESFKYHRDLQLIEGSNDRPGNDSDRDFNNISQMEETISQGVYQLLKIAGRY